MNRTSAAPKKTETDPRKLDIAAVAKDALAYALRRGQHLAWKSGNARMASTSVAEDAASESVASLFGGSRKWNPTKYPDAWDHVVSVINSLLWNRLVSSEEKAKPLGGRADLLVDPSDPEMLLLAKEEEQWQQHVQNIFEDRVLEDAELLAVYTAMEQLETDKPAELAKNLSLPVREIDNRKRRLRAVMSAAFMQASKERAEGKEQP